MYICISVYIYVYFYIIIIIIVIFLYIYIIYTIHNTECIVRSWMSIRLFLYQHSFMHIYVYSRMELKEEANSKPQCNNAQPIFIQPACIKISCHIVLGLICVPLYTPSFPLVSWNKKKYILRVDLIIFN